MGKVLPYGKQNINTDDVESVINALRSDFLTQGPLVEKFEAYLGHYLNAKHVITAINGTAALHLSGLALGLGTGDAVIVPAITFAATANSVLYCNATPVFADVDLCTGNISIESAEEAYFLAKKRGLNVKAIYPVHYSGLPCDPSELIEFSKKYNLRIVEDACHAFGAQYKVTESDEFSMAGTFADLAVWSFHPVKHLTTGEGGAVSTNDSVLARRLKLLRTHGITRDPDSFFMREKAYDSATGEINPWYHEMHFLGFNYRLPDILCALGISQLKRISSFVEKRREIAKYYQENLREIPFIQLPNYTSKNIRSSFHLFPLIFNFKGLGLSRKQVMDRLKSYGVGSQVHYIPVPLHPYYQNNPDKYLSSHIPNAMSFYENELSIPMYPDLSEDNLIQIVEAIRSLGKI